MAITKSNGIDREMIIIGRNRLIVKSDNSSLSFPLSHSPFESIEYEISLLLRRYSLSLSLSLSLSFFFILFLLLSQSLSLSLSPLPSDSVEGVFVASTSASHLILQFINKKVKKC